MAGINYGSMDRTPRKKRETHLLKHDTLDVSGDGLSDEQLANFSRKKLIELAQQKRAPSVAKSAAAELLERVSPKKERAEALISPAEAIRIADIYDAVFAEAVKARNEFCVSLLRCPHCGKELTPSWPQ